MYRSRREPAALAVLSRPRRGHQPVKAFQDRSGQAKNAVASQRRADAAARARKERHAKPMLDLANGSAEARPLQPQHRRGLPKAARIGRRLAPDRRCLSASALLPGNDGLGWGYRSWCEVSGELAARWAAMGPCASRGLQRPRASGDRTASPARHHPGGGGLSGGVDRCLGAHPQPRAASPVRCSGGAE